MKILLGIIEDLDSAEKFAGFVMENMKIGNVIAVKENETSLINTLAKSPIITVGYDEWKNLLQLVRKKNNDFESKLILNKNEMTCLLESEAILPKELRCLIQKALYLDKSILELPINEE